MASWKRGEDDDYMSDKVLAKCPDKRPGLVPAYRARQHKLEQKVRTLNQQNRIKPRKVMEADQREEGMGKALDSSNKGFAMLQRMGFKAGTGIGLGKSGSGLTEPVGINLRVGRTGLGHDTETTRKRNVNMAQQKAQAVKRQKMSEQNQHKFQMKQSERFFEKLASKDLYKSQRVCEQLDSQKGLTEPPEPFFWPSTLVPPKDEDDAKKRRGNFDDDDFNDEEENDEDDVDNSDDAQDDEEEDKQEDEDELLTPAEKLGILTMYLRNVHVYCVWCGMSFADKSDMAANCPGNTAEEHND